MSGTSYLHNKSISSDLEDLKRLQAQRDKLEKASLDYKSKGYLLETLTHENEKLKASLISVRNESLDIQRMLTNRATNLESEINVVETENEISIKELMKLQELTDVLEQKNESWKREHDRQAATLESLVDEAEDINSKIKANENEICGRREEFNRAKLDQQEFIKLKHSLDRQRHNYQILENDYNTFKKQNDDLRQYISALEEERIKNELLLQRLEEEAQYNKEDIGREMATLQQEIETQRIISDNNINFIDELRVEIDQLRKQNNYLKSKIELLD